MNALYKVGRAILQVVARLFYNLSYEGEENIPKDGGYLLICNHCSYSDPVLLALKVHTNIQFIAKNELFKNKLFAALIRKLGAVPVERGAGDESVIEWAQKTVKAGEVVGIFPEGTRSKTRLPLRPKSGAAYIVKGAQAMVLPAAITYYQKSSRFRAKVRVSFGKPIPYKQFGFTGESARELRVATRMMWDQVLSMIDLENMKQLPAPKDEQTEKKP